MPLEPDAVDARQLERIPGVAAASHWTWFGGIYQNEPKNSFGSFPVEPEELLAMYPEYVLPEEQKQAWLKNRIGAMIGRSLANRFEWKIGDRIQLTSPIWQRKGDLPWEFEISGIYDGAKKGTDTSGFFFRYDYFDEGRSFGEGLVGWYVVRIDNPERAAEVAAAIDAEFANSPAETKAEPEGAFAQGFVQQIGNISTILMAVVSGVFFTILLVSGNTMAQSVRERVGELGALKAMGFTTFGGLTIPLIASATATLLFRQFFLTFPDEMVEAAKIDGAGPLRFFKEIVVPLSRTNMAALFVMLFIYGWNQYLWPLLMTTSRGMDTIVIGITKMIGTGDAQTDWNLIMATTALAFVPPVAAVVLMQHLFVKGLVETEK